VTQLGHWTRDALAELRASRFRPRAWLRFLAKSFERAAELRRERPRAHRQALAVGAGGLLVWASVALAGGPALAAVGAGWWLLTMLMLDWHLGLLERPNGTPLPSLGAANVLSLARIGLVPVLPVLKPELLATALIAAGATNALDGYLARRRHEETRLGFWLDGVADALVLGTAAVLLLPLWAAVIVLARFALPAAAFTVSYFWRLERPPATFDRARVLGVALWAGLVLAALNLPLAAALAAVGGLGGLLASAASVRQARTTSRATASARPQRPGMLRSSISPMPSGSTGSTPSSSPSGSSPSSTRSSSSGVPVAQACGLDAVGYSTGKPVRSRR
jgi:phosphatidylglycerophosphate synthase